MTLVSLAVMSSSPSADEDPSGLMHAPSAEAQNSLVGEVWWYEERVGAQASCCFPVRREVSSVEHINNSSHETFGPTDLKSTYSVCTRRVFGGIVIEPRPSGLVSDALTTMLLTHVPPPQMMIPTYNKRGALFSIREGNPSQAKVRLLFLEEDTTMPYSGFEPESTRLQAEGHIHHTGWAAF
ncbi:uncharacterized protein TNCV_3252301 [Trichonephila clavipes]|nr:uncharacterized protein TNCV_3252301 [Trichonephila clavipes]